MTTMFKSALTGLKNTAMSAGKDALKGVKAAGLKTFNDVASASKTAVQNGLKDVKTAATDNFNKFRQAGKQTFDTAAKKVGTLVNPYGALNNLGIGTTSASTVKATPQTKTATPMPNDSVLPNLVGQGKKCKSCSRKSVKRTTKKSTKKFNKKSAKKSTKKSAKKSAKK